MEGVGSGVVVVGGGSGVVVLGVGSGVASVVVGVGSGVVVVGVGSGVVVVGVGSGVVVLGVGSGVVVVGVGRGNEGLSSVEPPPSAVITAFPTNATALTDALLVKVADLPTIAEFLILVSYEIE